MFLLGVRTSGNTEGLLITGPWGAEVNDIVVVGVRGFILNTEVLVEGNTDAGSGVPKKLGWVGVGVLAGRWISGIGGEGEGPGVRV